jgi:hypothetical protein
MRDRVPGDPPEKGKAIALQDVEGVQIPCSGHEDRLMA